MYIVIKWAIRIYVSLNVVFLFLIQAGSIRPAKWSPGSWPSLYATGIINRDSTRLLVIQNASQQNMFAPLRKYVKKTR